MSDLLSIGASGVRAYQTALSTVGENIANTGTAGYVRRTTDLREVGATGTGLNARTQLEGNGVVVGGIIRQANDFRSEAVRLSSADLARTETGATWLSRIEGALTENGLGDRLTQFFTSARSLASDPTSVPARAVLLERAGATAAAFAQTGQALARATSELDATAAQGVTTLNSLGAALAKVNDGLARSQVGSAQSAQLTDQRDQLLEQMSAISDLSVRFDPIGRAEVKLGGSGGPTFVQGNEFARVAFSRNDEGAVQFAVQTSAGLSSLSPNGGTLAGVAEGALRLASATQRLNALATDFATEVNTVQAGGSDLDGKPGEKMFETGTPASQMTVVLTDPRGIAAARAGAPAGSTDASNLDSLEAARKAGDWEGGLTALVTGNAAALEQKKLVAEAQGTIRANAVAAQQSASGVDLDTEAVELLRFQQAYQASSRVIQAARDVMQTLFDIR